LILVLIAVQDLSLAGAVFAASPPVAAWTDVVLLVLDGLWRSVRAKNPHSAASDVAAMAIGFLLRKQDRNELRDWPDWRTAPADKAIEHVR